MNEKTKLLQAQIKRGTHLVLTGFITAVLGVVGYCIVCFSFSNGQHTTSLLHADPNVATIGTFGALSLGMIAFGTLLWLIGSLGYLNASMKMYTEDE